jgi:hypothetical protein
LSKLFFLTNRRGAEDTEKEKREGKNFLTEPYWDITDPNEIEGFGKLGQIPLSDTFSIGLEYDSNLVGDQQLSSSPLEGFWKISLDASELKNSVYVSCTVKRSVVANNWLPLSCPLSIPNIQILGNSCYVFAKNS